MKLKVKLEEKSSSQMKNLSLAGRVPRVAGWMGREIGRHWIKMVKDDDETWERERDTKGLQDLPIYDLQYCIINQ